MKDNSIVLPHLEIKKEEWYKILDDIKQRKLLEGYDISTSEKLISEINKSVKKNKDKAMLIRIV